MDTKVEYKCYLILKLEYMDDEEVLEAQEEAQTNLEDFCNRNNIDLSIYNWESCTSLEEGYEETLGFYIETDIPEDKLYNVFEELRESIDYCNNIEIE